MTKRWRPFPHIRSKGCYYDSCVLYGVSDKNKFCVRSHVQKVRIAGKVCIWIHRIVVWEQEDRSPTEWKKARKTRYDALCIYLIHTLRALRNKPSCVKTVQCIGCKDLRKGSQELWCEIVLWKLTLFVVYVYGVFDRFRHIRQIIII